MIVFNTGRLYTEFGQRIAAKQTPEGGILFVDVDRGIEGHVPPAYVLEHNIKLTQDDVMDVYDWMKVPYWNFDRDLFIHQLRLLWKEGEKLRG